MSALWGRDKRPMVRCGCCDGQGEVRLPLPLWDTLEELRINGPLTAGELCEWFGHKEGGDEVGLTAMCNRLATLRDFGLVTREKAPAGHRASWLWHWGGTETTERQL